MAAPPQVWERWPQEDETQYANFIEFSRNSLLTESITEYVARVYPNDKQMLEVAVLNDWWNRRTAYVLAIKEVAAAQAQTTSYVGVSQAVKTALTAHTAVEERLQKLRDDGLGIDDPEYQAALKMQERLANILIKAAAAVTKIEIKNIAATHIDMSNGKVAVFSKEWDG